MKYRKAQLTPKNEVQRWVLENFEETSDLMSVVEQASIRFNMEDAMAKTTSVNRHYLWDWVEEALYGYPDVAVAQTLQAAGVDFMQYVKTAAEGITQRRAQSLAEETTDLASEIATESGSMEALLDTNDTYDFTSKAGVRSYLKIVRALRRTAKKLDKRLEQLESGLSKRLNLL
jgi:hypothetical protein